MGTSYEGALVVADVEQVRTALARSQVAAIVAPVAERRTAVLPREGAYSVADIDEVAAYLSGPCGLEVLAHSLYDSDLLSLYVYRGGECRHTYHSDTAYLVSAFEDDDGVMKAEWDGKLFDLDDPSLPSGPCGADPDVFLPFGTGQVDRDRLGAQLRGDGLEQDEKLFAEERHWVIAETLNLQPAALTEAYRHANVSDFPGAVLVEPGLEQ